jgi:hypothetical protein
MTKDVSLVERIRQSVIGLKRRELTATPGVFYSFSLDMAVDAANEIERLQKRLSDCEISLGTFDPGASSEYWLKYGSVTP